jgi:FSR family fosmidomycin resistance protein-like MFS transporter
MSEKITAAARNNNDKKALAGFAFLHFLNDLHATVLPTIIPMLVKSISISLTQAGILNAAFGLMHFVGQPVSGYIADRQSRPWFAVWGPLLSAASVFLLPLSPNYAFAFMAVILMGIGTAMFHPQGNGRAGSAANDKSLAFFISLFFACGSFGSAIGPLYIVYAISMIGEYWLPVLTIPVFFICLYLWKTLKSEPAQHTAEGSGILDLFRSLKDTVSKVWSIIAITSIRDAVFQGIKLFLPMLIVMRGGSIALGGTALFAVVLASTISSIIGGRLAGIIGDKNVLIWSITIAPAFTLLGLIVPGFVGICLLMLGFAFLESSAPVTTSIAQKRCVGARSTASSFSSGVSWGIANLFASPVGFAADKIGLAPTLYIVAVIPWGITVWFAVEKLRANKATNY